MPPLTEFEGLPVEEVGVEMPNAAGGLQEAMKFDPVEWHHGDEHFIVLRCQVKKVRHDPIEKDDFAGPQRRVHILHVDSAAPIEAKHVQKTLNAYQERIQKKKEQAAGVERLPLGDNDEHRHRVDAEADDGKQVY